MREKVGILPPTVRSIHWAMAARANRMYQHPSPSPVWATPAMFAHMSDQAHDPWDFITVGMAVLSTTLFLRVGEAVSIHLADISTTCRVSFVH